MKKILTILFIACSFAAQSQILQEPQIFGTLYRNLGGKEGMLIPTFCGTPTLPPKMLNYGQSAIAFDSCNHILYVYDPATGEWKATDIDVLQATDSSYLPIKKLDGTIKNVVILGGNGESTGVSGGSGTWEQTLTNQGSTPFTTDNTIDFNGHNFEWDNLNSFLIYQNNAKIGLQDSTMELATGSSAGGPHGQSIGLTPNFIEFYNNISDSSVKIKAKVDSSNADRNNIAWFDTDNILHRGALSVGGGTLQQAYDNSRAAGGETMNGHSMSLANQFILDSIGLFEINNIGLIMLNTNNISFNFGLSQALWNENQVFFNVRPDLNKTFPEFYMDSLGTRLYSDNNNGIDSVLPIIIGYNTQSDHTLFYPTPVIVNTPAFSGTPTKIVISDNDTLKTVPYPIIDSTVTLSSGTITVSDSRVQAGARIFVSYETFSGTTGQLEAKKSDIVAGTSFKITSSSATDNSSVNYEIINP
jgi:hypothetical protein